MARSTRFPAAVHILTLLAIKKGECCSSELIAKSLRTNAVVVRRIVGLLQEAGFVSSQAGSHGGAMLVVEPDKVTLRDIYEAVEDQSVFCMHDPHPECPVACSVKEQVNELANGAEEKMLRELGRTRLSSITKPAVAKFKTMAD
ncbi:MAG: Rrf2 family transcriptional regulator [Rubripirellula sp.]